MPSAFRFWVVCLLTFLFSLPAFAQTAPQSPKSAKPETVVVFDLIAEKDVQKGAANLLTEMVLDYAAKLGRFEVVGQKDLFKILNWEQQKQLQGCTDTGCLVNLAGAMGARYIVEGSLGIMGDQYMVNIKFIDAYNVKVLQRETRRVANDEKVLLKTVEELLSLVFKEAGIKPEAPLSVRDQLAADHSWRNGALISGGVMLAFGITFNVLAEVEYQKYGSAGSQKEANDINSRVEIYKDLMITGYVTGGALMVTGIVLYLLEPKGEAAKKLSGLSITTLPGGMGVAYGGTW